ncbi:unnamed protein product [Boreogadus saida]
MTGSSPSDTCQCGATQTVSHIINECPTFGAPHGRADCTPEASTERVWSWELQVDGGQEPFSPTGTDGGDGGARREVRGGRLEVLAVRSVAVVWREGRAAQGMQNGGLRRRSWRRPTWKGRHGGPGGGSSSSKKGLETAEVLKAMEGLEAEANLEALESKAEELIICIIYGEKCAVCKWNVSFAFQEVLEAEVLEAEVLEAEVSLESEVSLEAAVAWRSWRRPTWKGRHGGPEGPGGGQPGRPGDGRGPEGNGGPGGGGQPGGPGV